jgi:Rad3-related DNA helicase
MIHHGDQKVQEHDNIDDRVGPEHQHSPEPGEALDASQLKVVQIDEAKHSPEQCLSRLKQTVNRQQVLAITVHITIQCAMLLTSVQL